VLKWVEERAARIREKMQKNAERFDQKVIDHLTDKPNERDKVLELLRFHAKDYPAIEAEFNQSLPGWQALGQVVEQRKIADFLYRKLRLATGLQFADLMYEKRITSWKDYYWYGREWRSRVFQFAVIGTLAVSGAYLVYQIFLNPTFQADYYIFRLKKPNATADDRSRTRRELGAQVERKDAAQHICNELTASLRYHAMPAETAERILAVLIERRAVICEGEHRLPLLLVDALRAENSDVRSRIHNTVLFLAEERGAATEQALRDWKPAKNESAADVEKMIGRWQGFWKPKPPTVPAAKPSPGAEGGAAPEGSREAGGKK
jgi:hypothetical protein